MLMKISRTDPALFRPVGVASMLEKPIPMWLFRGILAATLVANVAFVLGVWHRHTGPVFAGFLLWVMCYRNSWSMIYHNDNLLVLHALILGLTPSADAVSVDGILRDSQAGFVSRLRGAASGPESDPRAGWRYGWPIRLMNTVTVLTYFLAGVAKVKGPLGWQWASGETLRRRSG